MHNPFIDDDNVQTNPRPMPFGMIVESCNDMSARIALGRLTAEDNFLRAEIQKLRDEMVFMRECFETQGKMYRDMLKTETTTVFNDDDVPF